MASSVDPFSEWYSRPLDGEDILAGGSLILLTILFIALYLLVVAVFVRAEKEIIGFRYLISLAVADILCMIQFAFLTGVAILTKSRLVSVDGRAWIQFYNDAIWFVSCFHLPLIAWSRLHAIVSPHSFRTQSRRTSYFCCLLVGWIAPLILKCATHFQPFMTTFYYEPAIYGMANDNFVKYITEGHSKFFLIVNSIAGFLPFVFYGYYILLIAIALLVRHRMTIGGQSNGMMKVERRLILPCALSSVVFIIGQVAIMQGIGSGKWSSWFTCFIFLINFAIQPVLIIIFSDFVRKGVYHILIAKRGSQSPEVFSVAPLSVGTTRSRS